MRNLRPLIAEVYRRGRPLERSDHFAGDAAFGSRVVFVDDGGERVRDELLKRLGRGDIAIERPIALECGFSRVRHGSSPVEAEWNGGLARAFRFKVPMHGGTPKGNRKSLGARADGARRFMPPGRAC